MMNEKIKAKWVAALNSGEYDQTEGTLKDSVGFCCLGVLTDIYLKEKKKSWKTSRRDYEGDMAKLTAHNLLPPAVQKWAGITNEDPLGLAGTNDRGVSFSRIADIINDGL